MSAEFATLKLWIAKDIGDPSFANADANKKFENDDQISLEYCIPKQFAKKRTDITGVQSDVNVHPDTGPAGALVEIQFVVDRSSVVAQDFLTALINMYGILNNEPDFKRGFIGLENTDNPELNVVPAEFLGYKLVQFEQIDPINFKARQIYRVLIQLGGKATDLPNLA